MRHWTVSLLRDGRTAREWHVWAETLTVGSHGAAKVRLPVPVEAWALRLTELAEPQEFDVGEFHLRIADTTTERTSLWERAQIRIETAASHAQEVPATSDSHPGALRTAVAALCLAGITHWAAERLAPDHESHMAHPTSELGEGIRPITAPQAPFAISPIHSGSVPATANAFLLNVGCSKAPNSALVGIVSNPTPQQMGFSQGGSASAASDLVLSHDASHGNLALPSWSHDGKRSWESLDQPPPEPPH